VIVEEIEKVSDVLEELCEYIAKNRIKNANLKHLMIETINYFDLFYRIFIKFDLNKIPLMKSEKDAILKKINTELSKQNKEDKYSLVLLDRIINIIYSLNGPLMATFI
jgi:hypothetical protein